MNKSEYLEGFIRGYFDAMAFTGAWGLTDPNDPESDPEPEHDWDEDALAPEVRTEAEEDCRAFVNAQWHRLRLAARMDARYNDGQWAGHDFWLTRNHHGAGFWDRGFGRLGDLLSDACKPYGEVTLYYGEDDKVYSDL